MRRGSDDKQWQEVKEKVRILDAAVHYRSLISI